MARFIDGTLSDGKGLKVAIVAARFNELIVERLVEGACNALKSHGIDGDAVTVVRCPGAFEIPQVARRLVDGGRYDAVVCLGCVIRGATAHFDYVAGHAAYGIAEVAMGTRVPVAFGVLTTNTLEQAIDRAGAKGGNKGFDAAMTAVEMANLLRALRQGS